MITVARIRGSYYLLKDGKVILGSTKLSTLFIRFAQVKGGAL